MISTKDISKYARHVFARSKGHPDKHIMHPQREWLLIVGSFLLLFLGGAVYAWQQFTHFSELPNTIEVSSDMNIPEYRAAMVREVHTIYGERQDTFETIMGDIPDTPVATTTPELIDETSATTTDMTDDLEVEDDAPLETETPTDAETDAGTEEETETIDLDAL